MTSMNEKAVIINKETRRQAHLDKESQRLMKLPNFVWEDVKKFLSKKYDLGIPSKPFSFEYFLYRSGNFKYDQFVNKINMAKVRLLWSLLSRRLGIGLIKDTEGNFAFVPLEHLDAEQLEALFETYKTSSRYEIIAGEEDKDPSEGGEV